MAEIIQFPEKKKENLQAVYVLLDTIRKMHDEDGYIFTSSSLEPNPQGDVVLTLVLHKNEPDDLPDITA
ncbi:MAG: hypothetical protein IJ545_07080 [Alphaproteobacteria bacterium]|nr:hypothetical protein [Alphaproteobacteria bacterium]